MESKCIFVVNMLFKFTTLQIYINNTWICLHIGIDFLKDGSKTPSTVGRTVGNYFDCIFLVWKCRTFKTIGRVTITNGVRFVPKLKSKAEVSPATCRTALFECNCSSQKCASVIRIWISFADAVVLSTLHGKVSLIFWIGP